MLKSFLVRHDVLLIRVSPEIHDYSIESDLIKKQTCIAYLHFIKLSECSSVIHIYYTVNWAVDINNVSCKL